MISELNLFLEKENEELNKRHDCAAKVIQNLFKKISFKNKLSPKNNQQKESKEQLLGLDPSKELMLKSKLAKRERLSQKRHNVQKMELKEDDNFSKNQLEVGITDNTAAFTEFTNGNVDAENAEDADKVEGVINGVVNGVVSGVVSGVVGGVVSGVVGGVVSGVEDDVNDDDLTQLDGKKLSLAVSVAMKSREEKKTIFKSDESHEKEIKNKNESNINLKSEFCTKILNSKTDSTTKDVAGEKQKERVIGVISAMEVTKGKMLEGESGRVVKVNLNEKISEFDYLEKHDGKVIDEAEKCKVMIEKTGNECMQVFEEKKKSKNIDYENKNNTETKNETRNCILKKSIVKDKNVFKKLKKNILKRKKEIKKLKSNGSYKNFEKNETYVKNKKTEEKKPTLDFQNLMANLKNVLTPWKLVT